MKATQTEIKNVPIFGTFTRKNELEKNTKILGNKYEDFKGKEHVISDDSEIVYFFKSIFD